MVHQVATYLAKKISIKHTIPTVAQSVIINNSIDFTGNLKKLDFYNLCQEKKCFRVIFMGNKKSIKRLLKKRHSKVVRQNDLRVILSRASQYHREGMLEKAQAEYQKALQYDPEWGAVWNGLGSSLLQEGKVKEAEKSFHRALVCAKPYQEALYNLGQCKQISGDAKGALECYRELLKKRPDFALAWNNLGAVYKEQGDLARAEQCFRKAISIAPDLAEAWNNLGTVLDESGFIPEAISAFQKALAVKPDYISALFNLGHLLQRAEIYDEAASLYQKILSIEPGHAPARFLLESLDGKNTPDAAPPSFVKQVFDQCANSFNTILVEKLGYETPNKLFELVKPFLGHNLKILDLGCGTGLGADLYRPFASFLAGVDLSQKMLSKARETGLYDQLYSFDINEKWPVENHFDLIYSSDVFVYLGNLTSVLNTCADHLNAEGLLAFSVEKLENERQRYSLSTNGRFAHSPAYVSEELKNCGFMIEAQQDTVLRKEAGHDVRGMIFVTKKI